MRLVADGYKQGIGCSRLKCNWIAWIVSDETTMEVQVKDNHTADMTGAIKTAKLLNPSVTKVVVREASTGKIINVCAPVKLEDPDGPWQTKEVTQDR